MNKKLIGILILLAGSLMLAAAVYYIYFNIYAVNDLVNGLGSNNNAEHGDIKQFSGDEQPPQIKKIVANKTEPVEESSQDVKSEQNVSRRAGKDDVKRLAASFAERFGSYSNQSNFRNIVDLKIFMSQHMREWADTYINERRAKKMSTSIYYGITTKTVAQEIRDYDDIGGEAVILVKTRRQEATGSTNNTANAFNQDILVSLVKDSGAWKVDSASWQ